MHRVELAAMKGASYTAQQNQILGAWAAGYANVAGCGVGGCVRSSCDARRHAHRPKPFGPEWGSLTGANEMGGDGGIHKYTRGGMPPRSWCKSRRRAHGATALVRPEQQSTQELN